MNQKARETEVRIVYEKKKKNILIILVLLSAKILIFWLAKDFALYRKIGQAFHLLRNGCSLGQFIVLTAIIRQYC